MEVQKLIQGLTSQCAKNVEGRVVLAIQDTTEPDFTPHRGRIADGELGPIGDHRGLGFFLHPVMVLDMETKFPLGFGDVGIWHRQFKENFIPQSKDPDRHKRPVEIKESFKWIRCANNTKETLKLARKIIHVSDRESDIYEYSARIPDAKNDIVIRSNANRTLVGQQDKLYPFVHNLPIIGTHEVNVPANKHHKKHTAVLDIKFAKITLAKRFYSDANDPDQIDLYVVEGKEQVATVENGDEPIHWILYSSSPVTTLEKAVYILNIYTLRWRIEVLFRTLKKGGLDLEASQMETGDALKKLSIVGLAAALKILQLTKARDGKIDMEAAVVFEDKQIHFLKALQPTLEGKTQLQKNPFPVNSLAWAVWSIARLGGWKGYTKATQPGPTTIARGLNTFEMMFAGYQLNSG